MPLQHEICPESAILRGQDALARAVAHSLRPHARVEAAGGPAGSQYMWNRCARLFCYVNRDR